MFSRFFVAASCFVLFSFLLELDREREENKDGDLQEEHRFLEGFKNGFEVEILRKSINSLSR